MSTKRRRRSHLSEGDLIKVFTAFAIATERHVETSDPSAFSTPSSYGPPAMGLGHINVQFMVRGSFGTCDDLFEAMRILRGVVLPKKET